MVTVFFTSYYPVCWSLALKSYFIILLCSSLTPVFKWKNILSHNHNAPSGSISFGRTAFHTLYVTKLKGPSFLCAIPGLQRLGIIISSRVLHYTIICTTVQKPSNVPAESKTPPLYSQVRCCCSACFSMGRQLGN